MVGGLRSLGGIKSEPGFAARSHPPHVRRPLSRALDLVSLLRRRPIICRTLVVRRLTLDRKSIRVLPSKQGRRLPC